jgi:hypothetical protein
MTFKDSSMRRMRLWKDRHKLPQHKMIHIVAFCSIFSLAVTVLTFSQLKPNTDTIGDIRGIIYGDEISTTTQTLDIWDQLDILSGGRDAKKMKCPPPLVRFDNVITKPDLGQNTTTPATATDLIPKIIHFTMRSRCIPQDLVRTLDRWKEVLPNYSIFFHDDDAIDRLINQHDWSEFPNLHDALKCIMTKGAMKIDAWRVLLLYKYGGVYSDIDNWPLPPFNETMIRTDLSGFFFHDAWNRPSQWFMGFERRHPMMYSTMHHIIKNLLDLTSLWRPKVVFTTGPDTVKNGYYDFLSRNCCNGTATESEMLKNGVVLTGMLQKKVLKSNPRNIITSKYGYKDIVAFNSTLNVTRDERITMESGVVHWQKANYKSQAKVQSAGIPRYMSCRQYIEKVNSGSLEPINY